MTCNVHTQAFPCVRGFPRRVCYSIDSGTLNGGSECFKAKAWHVKEINALLLSPALIRALLSAENDRACTFHYVLLLVSGAPRPSVLLALSFFFFFFTPPGKKLLSGANANLPAKYLFVGCKWWGASVILCANACLAKPHFYSLWAILDFWVRSDRVIDILCLRHGEYWLPLIV